MGTRSTDRLALAIGALALAVLTTGTATAATATLVNVADPSSGSKARVTSKGQLKVDPTVARPARGAVQLYPSNSYYTVIVPPTTATLALSDLTWTAWRADTNVWGLYLYQVEASTTDACTTGGWTTGTFLGARSFSAANALVEDLSTPLVLRPISAGASWCLVAYVADLSNYYSAFVSWTGSVVSGTLPPSGPVTKAPEPLLHRQGDAPPAAPPATVDAQ